MPTTEQIIEQSKSALKQWKYLWEEHAKVHSKYEMKPFDELENSGVGRAILCIANGYSFEENIDIIRENQDWCDIMACDKTIGHCLDNGIIPTYCMVCDASVSYEKYLEKYKDKLSQTTLLMNVCANPKWTSGGNWKQVYFFVNKDVLKTERDWCRLSGCRHIIPAATNVSNAMIVMLSQSDDKGRNNFFGYDKILTIGFDYSWRPDKHYYSFDKDGDGKTYYMRHIYCENLAGSMACTSGNLAFSAEWLDQYIQTFNLPVVQCSKESIFKGKRAGDLREQMRYKFRPGDAGKVRSMIEDRNRLAAAMKKLENELHTIGREHFYNFLATT